MGGSIPTLRGFGTARTPQDISPGQMLLNCSTIDHLLHIVTKETMLRKALPTKGDKKFTARREAEGQWDRGSGASEIPLEVQAI